MNELLKWKKFKDLKVLFLHYTKEKIEAQEKRVIC